MTRWKEASITGKKTESTTFSDSLQFHLRHSHSCSAFTKSIISVDTYAIASNIFFYHSSHRSLICNFSLYNEKCQDAVTIECDIIKTVPRI